MDDMLETIKRLESENADMRRRIERLESEQTEDKLDVLARCKAFVTDTGAGNYDLDTFQFFGDPGAFRIRLQDVTPYCGVIFYALPADYDPYKSAESEAT